MWVVAKINRKKINFFIQEIKEKCRDDIVLYRPSIQYEKIRKNKLEKNIKPLLEDYFFCFSNKFNDINFTNTLSYIKGLNYFLTGYKNNQNEIKRFVENCKFYQNAKGFITKEFFYNLISSRGKFVSGPFTNMMFDIIEKNKFSFKVLIGNYKVSLSKKDSNLFLPV